eukprot:446374_1
MRMPFILFQFERIFRILQFIQSQQYLNKIDNNNSIYKGYLDSFLMKIPLLTLSKIIYQQPISIQYNNLFKYIGQQLLTLIYSSSSIFITLLSNNCNDNIINITKTLMNNSLKIFRKTLESNQIIHYFSPSHFGNNNWIPPKFYNISLLNDKNNIKTLINNNYKCI